MKAPGEAALLEFLREIDHRLDEEGLNEKVALYILGGAAAAIAYGSPRATTETARTSDSSPKTTKSTPGN